jgi:hypothetical protein
MFVKLGSVPYTIKLDLSEGTLIVGADVFHQRNKNSVAAVVS